MNTIEIIEKLIQVVELGKINKASPYPPELKGQDGADELTVQALEAGLKAEEILNKGLMPGMKAIGEKFSQGKAFIPNMLISAKAMNMAMEHLKPFFEGGEVQFKGTLILGTVAGDLHDIGKNLVKMIMKGDGWKIVDLGVDVKTEQFVNALKENPDAIVGMSALLTTTMLNMKENITALRDIKPDLPIYVGGAAVSQEFANSIQATGYFKDPHGFAQSLN